MPRAKRSKSNKVASLGLTASSKVTKTRKTSSKNSEVTMSKNNNPPSSQTTGTANDSFPLGKLPAELREKIWEEAIPLHVSSPSTSQTQPKQENAIRPDQFGQTVLANFYSLQGPVAIALACRESHAVATRVQRRLNKGKSLYERNFVIPVLHDLLPENKAPLVPLITTSNPSDPDEPEKFLAFRLPQMLQWWPRLLSGRGKNTHARRMMDLLRAARDDQIKVVLPDVEYFILTNPPAPPAAAKKWAEKTYLVSLSDRNVWLELKGIAEFYGFEWDFADTMIATEGDKVKERERMIEEGVAPFKELWDGEVKRRQKAKKGGKEEAEELGEMPRVDVCVYVEVDMGGPTAMLGFKGVPDRRVFNDLIQYGIL